MPISQRNVACFTCNHNLLVDSLLSQRTGTDQLNPSIYKHSINTVQILLNILTLDKTRRRGMLGGFAKQTEVCSVKDGTRGTRTPKQQPRNQKDKVKTWAVLKQCSL